mmetsp:Transcript_131779/g.421657  ORF Transcript_131779/g.421657 Transcript_131779/m.421657 type:complete len:127 (-) Transcript_131779:192-572(-)
MSSTALLTAAIFFSFATTASLAAASSAFEVSHSERLGRGSAALTPARATPAKTARARAMRTILDKGGRHWVVGTARLILRSDRGEDKLEPFAQPPQGFARRFGGIVSMHPLREARGLTSPQDTERM